MDGHSTYSAIILLVKDRNSNFNITLFPNPANAFVNITVTGVPAGSSLRLRITDVQGNLIAEKKTASNTEKIATYQLSAGQYFIAIYSNTELIKTIPIIIQH